MFQIDRSVAVIKPKQPFVDWVNSMPDAGDDQYTIQDFSTDCSVILLPVVDSDEHAEAYIRDIILNFDLLQQSISTYEQLANQQEFLHQKQEIRWLTGVSYIRSSGTANRCYGWRIRPISRIRAGVCPGGIIRVQWMFTAKA